jgi:hypothetical protein
MMSQLQQRVSGEEPSLRSERTLLAILASFVVGLVIALINGMDVLSAIKSALIFSLLTGAVVAVLAWAVDYAREKGYSTLLAIFLVLVLNVVGILILLLLPDRRPAPQQPA